MLIGSMFSGLLGGLDIACERVFDAETAWQLDITGASVRRRHWPGVLQVEADVATVDPADLPRVDVLCGGFPCQDLSTAGKQAGLDGARSGLYRHVLRFARVIEPQYIVLENVSGLLPYMPRLVADFQALGYGLTYAVCEAADVGLPHLRRRVFVVGERGVPGRGRVEVDHSRRWCPANMEQGWLTPTAVGGQGDSRDVYEARKARHQQWPGETLATSAVIACGDPRLWPTATAGNPNEGESLESWEARRLRVAEYSRPLSEPLGMPVREWASIKASDAASPGPSTPGTRDGTDGLAVQVRAWPTPMVRADQLQPGALGWEVAAVREWATVTTRGYKSGDLPNRVGTEALSAQAGASLLGQHGKRLNPAWVETLMGVPQGWTLPDGPSLRDQLDAWQAPRGRYPVDWDRSVPWPGFDWEPARTLPDGPPVPGRPARIRGLGNGVVWQQAELGLNACVAGKPGLVLFYEGLCRLQA